MGAVMCYLTPRTKHALSHSCWQCWWPSGQFLHLITFWSFPSTKWLNLSTLTSVLCRGKRGLIDLHPFRTIQRAISAPELPVGLCCKCTFDFLFFFPVVPSSFFCSDVHAIKPCSTSCMIIFISESVSLSPLPETRANIYAIFIMCQMLCKC